MRGRLTKGKRDLRSKGASPCGGGKEEKTGVLLFFANREFIIFSVQKRRFYYHTSKFFQFTYNSLINRILSHEKRRVSNACTEEMFTFFK